MNPVLPSDEVRALAEEAGFDVCGLANLSPIADRELRYVQEWLEEGKHGSMSWMDSTRVKRLDPNLIMEDPKAIVCVGMSYSPPDGSAPSGSIAKYARGRDYHKIFSKRLKALESLMTQKWPTLLTRRYVDTGPVLEKYWAENAGIGWRGKHTNLVSRSFGSWLLLGEVILNMKVEADSPEEDHCGTCRNCIDVCPTGAITGPYSLDARLCISYLTIEYRGSIPRHLRRLMGTHIFGCDLCLDVCPWNRFSSPYTDRDFVPREACLNPQMLELASMKTQEEFLERFSGTPVMRAKREGLVRNVCVALGNSGDPQAIPALTSALDDVSPLVREHAAWALSELSSFEQARESARLALHREQHPEVIRELKRAAFTGPSREQ